MGKKKKKKKGCKRRIAPTLASQRASTGACKGLAEAKLSFS